MMNNHFKAEKNILFEELRKMAGKPTKHPKCLGHFTTDRGWGSEFECGYGTKIACEECKYSGLGGRKDPAAKCNQE